jgi:hypothetical protein
VIHGQINGLNPQEVVALPGHPEVTVPFDDLIKNEGEGVSTTRATVDGKRIEVKIAELLNGVESSEDRAKRAKEEERLGGVGMITTITEEWAITLYRTLAGGNFTVPSQQS